MQVVGVLGVITAAITERLWPFLRHTLTFVLYGIAVFSSDKYCQIIHLAHFDFTSEHP